MTTDADVEIDLDDEGTEGVVLTVTITVPEGVMTVMGEPSVAYGILTVYGVHVHGLRPNAVTAARLRAIGRAVAREMGYAEIVLHGAVRTTGANPGRRPKPLRFRG